MISPEQDDMVLRLRREADGLDPVVRPGQIDEVLGWCQTRRGEQRRQQARLWAAAVIVVVAMIGVAVIVGRASTPPERITVAAEVDQWPLRGDLAGDTALLDRAEEVWRASGDRYAPVGPVRALFAQRSPALSVNFLVVVLAGQDANGRTVLGYVTSPVTRGEPDSRRLLVRAEAAVEPGQMAVGFIAARPDPQDASIPDGGSVAFALAAPGVPGIRVTTSLVDHSFTDDRASTEETYWRILPAGVGAWNSTIIVGHADDQQLPTWLAAGVHDPASSPVSLHTADVGLYAQPAPSSALGVGDLVVTPDGVLGVVATADGHVDTALASLASHGRVTTAISAIPGTLTSASGGAVLFIPAGPGEIAEGNRIVLTSTSNSELIVNIGRLTRTDAGWRVERMANTDATTAIAVDRD
ncbi:hypothetical protein [Goodfellowiella coeruleoviolacea]|uniref:Uncharacterized protein n=1 Tax=Goodfellowiella coeruleoviolacea TaxID=334858 RepID=A0AAE3KJN6_9PSEU|nr:hypothetical protein [Goodfellowiella coeruleoviolacea]MCP2169282.1 hypothetical protein [Goodfellowiella coeruleoviolacea]